MEVLGWSLLLSPLLRAGVLCQSSPSFLKAGGDGRIIVTMLAGSADWTDFRSVVITNHNTSNYSDF